MTAAYLPPLGLKVLASLKARSGFLVFIEHMIQGVRK